MSTTTEFVEGLRDLVRRLDDEASAAYDLWSWLPSKKAAERHHGDYASNVQPAVVDILREAAMVMAEQAGSKLGADERAEWFDRCPCGEEHPTEAAPPAKKRTAARTSKARKQRP